jgi:hypothetical protein
VDSRQWHSGQWTVGSKQWRVKTADSGQWAVDSGQWAEENCGQ